MSGIRELGQRTSIRYADFGAHDWIWSQAPLVWRDRVELDFRYVPLNILEPAESWTDPDIVARWLLRMRSGRCIPPPVVCGTGCGTLYLQDGNHRYRAMKQYCAADRDAVIRVAFAIPRKGFAFRCHWFPNYRTYLLEPVPRTSRSFRLAPRPRVERAGEALLGQMQ